MRHSAGIPVSGRARAARKVAARQIPPTRSSPADEPAFCRRKGEHHDRTQGAPWRWTRRMSKRSGSENTSGSRFPEPSSRSSFELAGIGTSAIVVARVVWRRQAITDESRRSTSSTAFGIRDKSAQMACHALRSSRIRRNELPRRPVVVSCPANSKLRTTVAACCGVRRSPLSSVAQTSALVTSSRGSFARASTSSSAYLQNVAMPSAARTWSASVEGLP